MKSVNFLSVGDYFLQRADGLLADVDSARAKARNAVEMGERTLKEANETLQTLLGKVSFVLIFDLSRYHLL